MRLIDADKYKEEIMLIMQCWSISPVLSPSEADEAKSNLRTELNVLSNMPTAYDVDKVVEEIRKYADNVAELGGNFLPKVVIEIIKSGGVAND